jgi:hypothetical protein
VMSRPYVPIECICSTSLAHICGEIWRLVQPRSTARDCTVRWEALRGREEADSSGCCRNPRCGVSAAAALLMESSVCVGNALVELEIVVRTRRTTATMLGRIAGGPLVERVRYRHWTRVVQLRVSVTSPRLPFADLVPVTMCYHSNATLDTELLHLHPS